MRFRIRFSSIQPKLTLSFLLILVPLVSVSIFANYYSQNTLNEQIRDRTSGALLSALEYVDELTKNMDQQTLLIASNPNIVDIWKNIADPLSPDNLYGIHTVEQQLTSLTNVNGAVKEAFIVHGLSGNGVSTTLGGIRWPNVQQEAWFQQTINARGGLSVYVPTSSSPVQSAYLSDRNIYFSRLLDVFGNNQEPNVMILAVDKSSFGKIIQHLQTSNNMDISLFYNGGFVLDTNPESLPSRISRHLFSIEEQEEGGEWSIRLEQPQSELFQQSAQLQLFIYLIIVLSVILAVWIAWLVYVGISKPLHQLSGALKQFSHGNLYTRVQHRRKDEFGYIMDAFNRMADSQRKLIEDDYEKELRLAKSELNLLQSQINPHFLYNTLDTIYSVAVKNRIGEISEMVINLSKFFRVSLGKGRSSFTLAETVQHLMYYIRIQQIRTDHFTTRIELEESTKDVPILKLLLQPLVENAIVHGLEKNPQGGELLIRAVRSGDQLRITIADTGTGIAAERVAEIQRELERINSHSYRFPQENPSSHFYGLKNVKSRLKLYYGEAAELKLDSEYKRGTTVTLVLPIGKEKAE